MRSRQDNDILLRSWRRGRSLRWGSAAEGEHGQSGGDGAVGFHDGGWVKIFRLLFYAITLCPDK